MNTKTVKAMTTGVSSAERRLGKILVELGKLRLEDTEKVLQLQKSEGLMFGEAAIKLGLVDAADLAIALARQFGHLQVGTATGFNDELTALFGGQSREAESLRAVRTQLNLRWFDRGHHALAIISPSAHEGRSYIAAHLALLFAQLGQNTLLIDADLHNAHQHEIFYLSNRVGLSSVLADIADPSDAIHKVESTPYLSIMTSGPIPPNPAELISRVGLTTLLDSLATKYKVIIIDTPAALAHAEVHNIAISTKGALLVTRLNHTRLRSAKRVCAAMTDVGVEVVGSILNEA